MNYQEFKEAIIRLAAEKNISEYELYYTADEGLSVDIYKKELNGYSTESGMGICLRCVVGGKIGYASTENLSLEEAKALVDNAIMNAQSIESEEPAFLHVAGDEYVAVEPAKTAKPSGEELIDFALKLQDAMYAEDERVIDGTGSTAGYGTSKCAIYNSKGIDLMDEAEYAYAVGSSLVRSGDEMYNGFDVATGDFAGLDFKKLAKEAVEDAVSTIGSTSVDSGKYDVLFSGKVMASLLSTYSGIFSAEKAMKGLSLLNGKEGESVASELITLTDDPFEESALIKRTFDAEGVATYKKNVIENGVLKTLLHNLKTAATAGVKTTGNASKAGYAAPVDIGFYSFYINPVEGDTDEMLGKLGNGIYLTGVSGLHAGANPVTGDFSLSSEGFMVENGKKTVPVKNFTVSGNFYELLKAVKSVGADLEFSKMALSEHRTGSPSILIPDVMVAGK